MTMHDPDRTAYPDLESAMWGAEAEVGGARDAIAQVRPAPRDAARQANAKQQIAADLATMGTTIDAWFADIDPAARFLGLPIEASSGNVAGVHKLLLRRLALVEQRLMQELGATSLADCARQLGVHTVQGLRLPKLATGGTRVSMHCFGLAIDVNYTGNPFLGQHKHVDAVAVIKRATRLVSGVAVNIMDPPVAADAGKTWDRLQRASEDFKTYFQLGQPGRTPRLTELAAGSGQTVTQWQRQIAADAKLLDHNKAGDFTGRDPRRGFLDLDRRLVRALVETGGLLWGGMYQGAKDLMHFDWRGPRKDRDSPKSWLQVDTSPASPAPRTRPPGARPQAPPADAASPPGQTIYATIPLGLDHLRIRKNGALVPGPQFTLPARTGIFVPASARPSREVDVIVYLHGFLTNVCGKNAVPGRYDTIDDYWRNPYFLLREGLHRTGRDFVLVAPSLGPHAQSGSLGRPGGFDAYMTAVLDALAQHGPPAAPVPRTLGNIILAGHSAGGATMRAIATGSDAHAGRIRECWGFDCLYDRGDPSAWAAWAKARPQARLYVYYNGTKANALELGARRLPNVVVEPARGISHCDVPRTYWQRRIQAALRQPAIP